MPTGAEQEPGPFGPVKIPDVSDSFADRGLALATEEGGARHVPSRPQPFDSVSNPGIAQNDRRTN